MMMLNIRVIAAAAILMAPITPAAGTPGHSPSTNTSTDQLGPNPAPGPDVECGVDADALNRPGQAEFAPGSAFNPDGTAGTVYAGEQDQNSRNTASFSRYDVACSHQNH